MTLSNYFANYRPESKPKLEKLILSTEEPTMICNVILSKQDNNYIARAKDWPEAWTVEATRDQAILRIKNQLLEYLTQELEMISIAVPIPTHTGNPWLEKFGLKSTRPLMIYKQK